MKNNSSLKNLRCVKYYIIVVLLFSSSRIFAQSGRFEAALNYNYTTNAKLFLFPFSPDPIVRNKFLDLEDIFNFSANVRLRITPSLQIGLNIERIIKTGKDNSVIVLQNSGLRRVEVADGFEAYLIEFSLIYILPFSSNRFKIFMGGGAGAYPARQIRRFGKAKIKSKNKDFPFGIQTLAGVEYYFRKDFALRFQMVFREPEIKLLSTYVKKTFEYNGTNVTVINDTFETRVDIDGAVFVLGLVFNF